jgi:cytochrome c-type biogenesis protein CcmE
MAQGGLPVEKLRHYLRELLVQTGSLVRGDNHRIHFRLTDGNRTIPVAYQGVLPDLFREGRGAVTEGTLDSSGTFLADVVLAKHDEQYMPKNVVDRLKAEGRWKDDYAKKAAGGVHRSGP